MADELRPPVVTILGHVDHGKTTLLDFIRKSSVASSEHGGITQHIGAYQAIYNNQLITFIDTPGHAAFEKMRSRGAAVADIAVLVVALDDGVMPQTVEAIKHIKETQALMIVAINKIDLPGINIQVQLEKIKKQLSDNKVLIEEYGGEVPLIQLSAKTGEGVEKLLEMILLVSELHEFRADPSLDPQGVVIESSLDKFKGPVATILIKDGTLKKGQEVLIGGVKGKIRAMFDFSGKQLDEAKPSTPVEVMGLTEVPSVGSFLGQEKQAVSTPLSQTSLLDKLREEKKLLKIVIKADKQGSLEAIEHSLEKFNEEKKLIEIIQSGVGDISEADIKLAASIKAIAIGFNVKVLPMALRLAEEEKVLVRTYNIIYELLEEMEDVVEAMLKPGHVEEVLGRAEIIAEFPHSKTEKIAGCRVIEGFLTKGSKTRVLREGGILGETKIKSLKKVKEEVNRVEKGQDCGIIFDPQLEFQTGDTVEIFRVI